MQTVWNRINTALLVLVLLVLAGALAKGVYGGPMDPSGPPASTLPQVEPHMPIPPVGWDGSFPIVISQTGSYFLTQDIYGEAGKDGIQITANFVTLDLNGFGVYGGSSESLKGVHVTCSATCYVIKIKGGAVIGWGGDGIDMGLTSGGSVTDMSVGGNYGSGVVASAGGNNIIRNEMKANNGDGIVGSNNLVQGNLSSGNGGDGISDSGSGSHIVDNIADSNTGRGIAVQGSAVVVVKNIANANGGGNYVIAGGNDVGPIGTANASTRPWANISD